jgi:hypothetical protein
MTNLRRLRLRTQYIVIACMLVPPAGGRELVSFAGSAHAEAVTADVPLDVLATVGPWPTISRVIAYGGRIWFANSVKGRNHNSADVWSLDPADGSMRYERHLFSQDAGAPLVHDGLLYWPHEDSRASLGWGSVSVTDGPGWRDLLVPTATIFHVHGMVSWYGGLLASTSAWRAGLQLSRDGGSTWREVYEHPTAEGRVSRMSKLVLAGESVVGLLRDSGTNRLVVWSEDDLRDVAGWEPGGGVRGLTSHMGIAYWIDSSDGQVSFLGANGAEQLDGDTGGRPVLDITSLDGALWALTSQEGGGRLWRYDGNRDWERDAAVAGGRPVSIAAAGGRIFVAGTADDGSGILWGRRGALEDVPEPGTAADLPPASPLIEADREALRRQLLQAFGDIESFRNHGRDVLRPLVYDLARSGPAGGDVLSSLLGAFTLDDEVDVIGGQSTVAASHLGQWILLWGIGLAGAGEIPVGLLENPWAVPESRSEKYFDPLPMALWALTQTGQNDSETVAALIARLDRAGDPLWLRGDFVGALTALTDARYGYDVGAWQAWWDARAE